MTSSFKRPALLRAVSPFGTGLLVFIALALFAASSHARDAESVSPTHLRQLCNTESASVIHVRFASESGLFVGKDGVTVSASASGQRPAAAAISELLQWNNESLRVERLFGRSVAEIAERREELLAEHQENVPDLNRWGIVRLPGDKALTGDGLRALLEKLNSSPLVSVAYPRPVVSVPSPLPPKGGADYLARSSTPDFTPLQDYLTGPSSNGVNATFVSGWTGGQGGNVKIVDVEYDWNWDHEDLKAPFESLNNFSPEPYYKQHGTASVGILVGQDNGFGITGIVPDAAIGGSGAIVGVASAINNAAALLAAGDIMMIELHVDINWPNTPPVWRPVEYIPSYFDAIRVASQSGIVVVEAAGNSVDDLDLAFPNFVRDGGPYDCMAIMAGAYNQYGNTLNYGNRVDACARMSVMTTGYGTYYGTTENEYYRANFGGTSSTTPIVAGSVASIQSMHIAEMGVPLTPLEIRDLVRATGNDVPIATNPMGPRPDIAEAMRSLLDGGAPQPIDNLTPYGQKSNWIALYWNAPVDDFRGMPAETYDLRYSETPITDANFDMATPVPDVGAPLAAGLMQGHTATGLNPSTTYYFAIKSSDPYGNVSPISNIASATTDPPSPEIVVEQGVVDLGEALVGEPVSGQMEIQNVGSADLVITNCEPLHGPDAVLTIVNCPAGPIPPGGSATVDFTLAALTPTLHTALVRVHCNDPDTPEAIKAFSVQGLDAAVGDVTLYVLPGGQDSGNATIQNISDVTLNYEVREMVVGIENSHGQPLSNYLPFTYFLSDEGIGLADLNTTIDAASLSGVDVLLVTGTESWTPSELSALEDWVNTGGGLFITCPVALESGNDFNPLLDQLGLGTSLMLEFGVETGAATIATGHELTAGVSSITLGNALYKLSGVPAGASWILRTPDGTTDKAFSAEVGDGRVLFVADHLFGTYPFVADHDQFARNALEWLTDDPWLSASTSGGSLAPGASETISVAVDAGNLPEGQYDGTVDLEVAGGIIPLNVTMNVVDVTISNIARDVTGCDEAIISWETSQAVPGSFRYREYGTQTWSGPYTTPIGTSHEVTVPTQLKSKYDGLIECAASEQFIFKTLSVCIPSAPPQEHKVSLVTDLVGGFPNPFNPTTTIRFSLAAATDIELRIFDVSGRLVRTLVDGRTAAGAHDVSWGGLNDTGSHVSSGVYFVRMRAGDYVATRKLIMIK